jgi:hypothetical protein
MPITRVKHWYQSKTVWINALTIAAGLPLVVEEISAAVGGVALLPESLAKYLLVGAGVANIVLRRLTDEPMRFTPDESDRREYGVTP